MSETLGCGHPDKNRACGDCLDETEEELNAALLQIGELKAENGKLFDMCDEQGKALGTICDERQEEINRLNRLNDELKRLIRETSIYHCGEVCGVDTHDEDCQKIKAILQEQEKRKCDCGADIEPPRKAACERCHQGLGR